MPAGRSAFLLVLLALALTALPLVASLPPYPLIMGVLNNAAHAPVFGALAVVIFVLLGLHGGGRDWSRYIAAFVVAVAAGGIVELIQPALGRGGELADLRTDAIGAIGGLAIVAILSSRWRWQGAILLALALITGIWPLANGALAYWQRAQQFPVLFNFASRHEWYFISTPGMAMEISELPERWRQLPDPPSLHLRIVNGLWPGVIHNEPQPDWRGYSRLMVDLTNADSRPLALVLRVHDREHDNRVEDRFSRSLILPPETRTVFAISLGEIARAPAGRTLDLAHVAGVIIFANDQSSIVGREYYLTRIWLE